MIKYQNKKEEKLRNIRANQENETKRRAVRVFSVDDKESRKSRARSATYDDTFKSFKAISEA